MEGEVLMKKSYFRRLTLDFVPGDHTGIPVGYVLDDNERILQRHDAVDWLSHWRLPVPLRRHKYAHRIFQVSRGHHVSSTVAIGHRKKRAKMCGK